MLPKTTLPDASVVKAVEGTGGQRMCRLSGYKVDEQRAQAKSLLTVVNTTKAKENERDDLEGADLLPGEALQIL